MGIEGLLQALRSITAKKHIKEYAGRRAAIDASAWLYKGAYSCAWELSQGYLTSGYLHFAWVMLKLLQHYSITPVVVFDGLTLPLKEGTARKRKQEKKRNRELGDQLLAEGNLEGAKAAYSRALFMKRAMTYRFVDLLSYLNIPYVVAPYEADAQIAYMCQEGLADFAISEDSDLLVYGCADLVLKLDTEGNCENIRLPTALLKPQDEFVKDIAALGRPRFMELCVVAGCDYLSNIPGIGLKRAVKLLRDSTLEEVVEDLRNRLQYEGKISAQYAAQVRSIALQFEFGKVIDPRTFRMTTFRPLPSGWRISLEQLGKDFDPTIVEPYAQGLYNVAKARARDRLRRDEVEKIKHELETFRWTKSSPQSIASSAPPPLKTTELKAPPEPFPCISAEALDRQTPLAIVIRSEVPASLFSDAANGLEAVRARSVDSPDSVENDAEESKAPPPHPTPTTSLEPESRLSGPKERLSNIPLKEMPSCTGISPPRWKRAKIIDDNEEAAGPEVHEVPEVPEVPEETEEKTSNPTIVLGVRRLHLQEILRVAIQKLDEFFQQPTRSPSAEFGQSPISTQANKLCMAEHMNSRLLPITPLHPES